MSSKLWGGRFDLPTNKLVEEFNATILIEKRLFPVDIKGSIAHATMLAKQNIITQEEADLIISGLQAVAKEVEEGQFVYDTADEDVHMSIEKRMTEIIGPVGGKLHTARSRNDQTTLDSKMHMRGVIQENLALIREMQKVIVERAKGEINVIMPGYTHLQTGQPILFSHWIMAYFWMLERDYSRFEDLYERMGLCPLGSAALAGTTFDIDRFYTAELLGFDAPTPNSIDSVSDRDHMVEFNAAAAICFMHLSRLSEELVLFSSQDFKFIELSDDFCTGSSIMPQKKNPDIAEKIRGKTGRMYGNLMAILTTMKGLPLAYNTDMSEDKEAVYDSMDTLQLSLQVITPMIEKMVVLEANTRDAADRGFSVATDMADYLVRKGLPFREAHHVVGSAVNYCIKHDKKLNDLSLEEFRDFHPSIEEDIYQDITLEACVSARISFGGTAPQAVLAQIERAESIIAE
ncbi:argininosuccinate lyase [Photobacterium aphoticum]|uniref:Argininosuccinate lyase n=1 Tax=Photobacterium aphoticum TaxID=754436 RepID=A0A090QVC3_9GAMM|nr:argininosuccinate lyase [Photobacterium aphoticum]KLU99518.1 argininosuccinate lyase [Photobacterium aphoticum]PSU57112.1 argininosuccinate lyase [Photobacterium aphoticum]GAL06213.1 argininosuccinate lyase [Photobacterium aphoticum]GHA52924.1 argininosuccinate lyase [Photobacterium aphoticum]